MKSKMICFIGLDGSGKSTSVDHAYDTLKTRGVKVKKVRAAYVIKFMSLFIKLGKKLVMKENSDPYGGEYKSYLESMRKQSEKKGIYRIFSMMTTFEFKCQIFFSITMNRLMGYTILVDRYIYDNAVTYAANLGKDEGFLKSTIEKKWKNAPKPDCIIYIKTPVDTCLSRKDDIPDPLYLTIREPLYDSISDMYNATVISGEQNKEDMLNMVTKTIDAIK